MTAHDEQVAMIREALEVTLHCRANHADSRPALAALKELAAALTQAQDDRNEYIDIAERESAKAQQMEEALREVHEYQCGCDEPGRLARCVAKPVESFAALSPVPQAGKEGR